MCSRERCDVGFRVVGGVCSGKPDKIRFAHYGRVFVIQEQPFVFFAHNINVLVQCVLDERFVVP